MLPKQRKMQKLQRDNPEGQQEEAPEPVAGPESVERDHFGQELRGVQALF